MSKSEYFASEVTLELSIDALIGVCQSRKGEGLIKLRGLAYKVCHVIMSEVTVCKNMLPVIMQGVLLGKVVEEFVFICVPHTQHNALYLLRKKFKG